MYILLYMYMQTHFHAPILIHLVMDQLKLLWTWMDLEQPITYATEALYHLITHLEIVSHLGIGVEHNQHAFVSSTIL